MNYCKTWKFCGTKLLWIAKLCLFHGMKISWMQSQRWAQSCVMHVLTKLGTQIRNLQIRHFGAWHGIPWQTRNPSQFLQMALCLFWTINFITNKINKNKKIKKKRKKEETAPANWVGMEHRECYEICWYSCNVGTVGCFTIANYVRKSVQNEVPELPANYLFMK